MKDFNIDMIEALTIEEAKSIALEVIEIKEHECVFVDFEGYFGYSVLVFKNGKHIYYADDFELHHSHMGKETLKQWYIDTLNRKLFIDAELLEDVKTYDEYKNKINYLRNYYILRYDFVSMFAINEEERKAIEEGKKTHPFFNPISYCYVADKYIIEMQSKYLNHLKRAFNQLKNNMETFREMVSYQLANYEACISYRYEDALDALGMKFEDLTEEKQKVVKEELEKQINNYYGNV